MSSIDITVDIDWLLDNRPGQFPRDLPSLEFLMIAWGFKIPRVDAAVIEKGAGK